MSDYSKFIRDKKVLIVCPANYLEKHPVEKRLLEYDTIIRINSCAKISTKSPSLMGTKTDIVYTTYGVDAPDNTNHRGIDKWVELGVKHVRLFPPPVTGHYKRNIETFKRDNNFRIEHSITRSEMFSQMVNACGGTIPNTGFAAVMDTLAFSPTILHVTGLTFFKGGYVSAYGCKTNDEKSIRKKFTAAGNHDIDKQLDVFRKLYKNNDNLHCDRYIVEVLGL